ncbi:hypothetical protein R3P38DRAFT_3320220 [Favolaschia claudopus]|uniref:CxC1-like cysteine cluster associated with KDZ transposases domain-containing protein n=1 Tax=Favolaschia claudopus TaxID=2862362 RepID=A0AAW0B0W2_9AGAR
MSEEHLENFRTLRVFPEERESGDEGNENSSFIEMRDVISGATQIEISHGGGEFIETFQQGLEEEVRSGRRRMDYRTRDDRTKNMVNDWNSQMDRMTKSYMSYCANSDLGSPPPQPANPGALETYEITVVDVYGKYSLISSLESTNYSSTESNLVNLELNAGGVGVPSALLLQGLVPCSPWTPSVAITVRALELYRVTHIRCPQLAIQPFVKALCDLHSVPYRPYLRQQFSNCYDLYLELRRQTEKVVKEALGRDTPDWRLKHACPACMYKLEGEEELVFAILKTMDGNNSLKRVLRRRKTDGSEEEPTLGPSVEREDPRDGGEDYFLSRERVDRWAKTRLGEILATEDNPCASRWKNMMEDVTSKMWGVFDETGIFLALCRHGFVLLVEDMVKSGELTKYPLAMVDALLDAFGLENRSIGKGKRVFGYDCGCSFETTVKHSPLTEKAQANGFRSLVGSFHGHAHNRRCQLSFLATYVKGLGLEDLEGCEHYFSRSNALVKCTRYASKFHRRQEITTFMKQIDDLETSANLSKFLCDNYRQAIKILRTEPALKQWMVKEGVDNYEEFRVWLEEEKSYLERIGESAGEKRVETLEMEYVQKLINLEGSRKRLNDIRVAQRAAAADDADYNPAAVSPVARRHAQEQYDRDLDVVKDLELQLSIDVRWTSESPEWPQALQDIANMRFQKAVDAIEVVIVERLLEMTKAGQGNTGYKLRHHIAKALQARSKAIRNAIDRYNTVALSMDPPMPTLSSEEVVNYGFLSEFDILRDTDDNIRNRPWTRLSYRLALDKYFKLNIEIKRVVTWIDDEDWFLRKKEAEYKTLDPTLACHIDRYRQHRARSDSKHMSRFWELAKTPGFTGSVSVGVAVEKSQSGAHAATANSEEDVEMEEDEVQSRDRWAPAQGGEWEDVDSGDEGEDAEQEAVSGLIYQLSVLASDPENRTSMDLAV